MHTKSVHICIFLKNMVIYYVNDYLIEGGKISEELFEEV